MQMSELQVLHLSMDLPLHEQQEIVYTVMRNLASQALLKTLGTRLGHALKDICHVSNGNYIVDQFQSLFGITNFGFLSPVSNVQETLAFCNEHCE